jgi:adenosylmethionine---8-amino-7-oxononanoate aminotransferase
MIRGGDPVAALADADKRHVWHPFTQMKAWCADGHEPLVLVDGEGAILRDAAGREYIDGNASIWTNIHGHRHPGITAAIKDQLDRVAHVSFLGTTHPGAVLLAGRLAALAPGTGLDKVFFSDNGSTAIEVAVKMALQFWQLTGHPERRRFAAFESAYHGDTAGAASLGGVGAFFDRFAPLHFEALRVAGLDDLERLPEALTRGIAGVVIEPLVRGAAGIRLWPPGMLRGLRAWCDRTGVLLIADEVLTGFGRTGTLFACEREGVRPDFLCLAKGLTGGFMPLAATLTTQNVFDAFLGGFEETFFYGHSYCANPLACAAALAGLDAFEQEHTLEALQPKIALLSNLLDGLRRNPRVRETRQCGLIAGIELQQATGQPLDWRAQTGARVCLAARAHGLLTRPVLDTVTLIPPLCISHDQLEQTARALECAIESTG